MILPTGDHDRFGDWRIRQQGRSWYSAVQAWSNCLLRNPRQSPQNLCGTDRTRFHAQTNGPAPSSTHYRAHSHRAGEAFPDDTTMPVQSTHLSRCLHQRSGHGSTVAVVCRCRSDRFGVVGCTTDCRQSLCGTHWNGTACVVPHPILSSCTCRVATRRYWPMPISGTVFLVKRLMWRLAIVWIVLRVALDSSNDPSPGYNIEVAAKEYAESYKKDEIPPLIELPYVVKGMDVSFSGILTAVEQLAKQTTATWRNRLCVIHCKKRSLPCWWKLPNVPWRIRVKIRCWLWVAWDATSDLQEMMEDMVDDRKNGKLCAMDHRYCIDNGAMIAQAGILGTAIWWDHGTGR